MILLRDEAQSKLDLRLNAKIKLRLWLNFWQQNSAIAMNAVVTSDLPVCLYSAAGKQVNRQDFFHWANSRPHPLHGGTASRSEIVSFPGNELREGVFRTFGFPKPKRLFSRIKLVTKNDLASRRGYCWDYASSPKVL